VPRRVSRVRSRRPGGGSPSTRRKRRRQSFRRPAAIVIAIAAAVLLFAGGIWLGSRLDRGDDDGGGTTRSGVVTTPPAPVAPRTDRDRPEPSPLPPLGPLVALVIDDLGRSVNVLDELRDLGVPLTYSVLPFESRTAEVVEILTERRVEVLCHLPMEADGDADPGPGALLASMSRAELRAATERALAAVPAASGVNNHMGSVLSANRGAMDVVLDVLAKRKLFFLDSRTSPRSVGYALALEKGIPAAERQVFLDPDPAPDAVRSQFRELLRLADERGSGIAIGHPHPDTLEVLRQEISLALAAGYRFVPLSYLLDRSDQDLSE